MKALQNDHYSYRVTWSAEDNEYIGLCVEFPSLSWLAPTPEDALQGIRETVAEVIEDMKTSGETIPEPLTSKHYSGKFIVRVPPEVHRMLALEAAESGVSLNRLASARLTHWENTPALPKRDGKHFNPMQGRSRMFRDNNQVKPERSVRLVTKTGKNSTV
ncbi:MAG: toxin-antitoxin system HicB family antitoxin [Fibrobacter sp.]|nr:toxin-antitoxin system HicB family antitoxin [Fibrobacter sp.]